MANKIFSVTQKHWLNISLLFACLLYAPSAHAINFYNYWPLSYPGYWLWPLSTSIFSLTNPYVGYTRAMTFPFSAMNGSSGYGYFNSAFWNPSVSSAGNYSSNYPGYTGYSQGPYNYQNYNNYGSSVSQNSSYPPYNNPYQNNQNQYYPNYPQGSPYSQGTPYPQGTPPNNSTPIQAQDQALLNSADSALNPGSQPQPTTPGLTAPPAIAGNFGSAPPVVKGPESMMPPPLPNTPPVSPQMAQLFVDQVNKRFRGNIKIALFDPQTRSMAKAAGLIGPDDIFNADFSNGHVELAKKILADRYLDPVRKIDAVRAVLQR